MPTIKTTPAQAAIYFASGSTSLCLLATLQKFALGTPLELKGYILPFVFGGTAGMIIGFRQNRLQESNQELQRAIAQLQKSNENLLRVNEALEKRTTELEKAFLEIKHQQRIIPICAKCKKIRSSDGQWSDLDKYIQNYSEAQFSHGLCPHCAKELYPELNLIPAPKPLPDD